jgi:transposase-like protein
MKARKILDSIEKSKIEITPVFTNKEVTERHDDYKKMSDRNFDENYREKAFCPIHIGYQSFSEDIQYNYCTDPYCPNFGEPLEIIIPRSSRSVKNYMFTNKKEAPLIRCNIMNYVGSKTRVDNNSSTLISNWSLAEEIKRLTTLNSVINDDTEYTFHESICTDISSPFDKQNCFIKYVKTGAGATRFKCKECGKVTSVKPSTKERHNYGLKLDNITLQIFQDIISRVPVKSSRRSFIN